MGCSGPGASEQTEDSSLEKGAVGLPALPWETASLEIHDGDVEVSKYSFCLLAKRERGSLMPALKRQPLPAVPLQELPV